MWDRPRRGRTATESQVALDQRADRRGQPLAVDLDDEVAQREAELRIAVDERRHVDRASIRPRS